MHVASSLWMSPRAVPVAVKPAVVPDRVEVHDTLGDTSYGADAPNVKIEHSPERTHTDLRYTFPDGREVTLRSRGADKPVMVRVGNGPFVEAPALPHGHLLQKVDVDPDGNLTVQSRPRFVDDPVRERTPGSRNARYKMQDGKLVEEKVEDLSTAHARNKQISDGRYWIGKGNTGGVPLMERAYAAKLAHEIVERDRQEISDPLQRQRVLAKEYGAAVGEEVAKLEAAGKHDQARAVQSTFLMRLNGKDSPFADESARALATKEYTQKLLDQGHPVATRLIPEIAGAVGRGPLYLDPYNHKRLTRLAEERFKAGDRGEAQALYKAAGQTATDNAYPLLNGVVRGDKMELRTRDGGTLTLGEMGESKGAEMQAFAGQKTSESERAAVRARQLEMSNRWMDEAKALRAAGKLQLTAAELEAVPPSTETMKKYFTAKYDGKMPAAREELQAELARYLPAAFAHPSLDVPDDFKAWKTGELAATDEGRSVADCLVMNRAVAHMLSGVGGLELRPIEVRGHTRLLVSTADGEGFIQSNDQVAKLEGSGSDLAQRAQKTISKSYGLQVLHGMPAPLRVGAPIATGKLDDAAVDSAYDTSREAAAKSLAEAGGAEGKLRKAGDKVDGVLMRYDALRASARDLFERYRDAKPEERKQLEPERKALLEQYKALKAERAALGAMPDAMDDFLKREAKYGGAFYFNDSAISFLTSGKWSAAYEQRTPFDPDAFEKGGTVIFVEPPRER